MEHAHHHHAHTIDSLNRAFLLGIALNIIFVVVELVAGVLLTSVALISDAGHNLSDVVSLALAMLAFRLAKRPPTATYTYGRKKSTVLVSLLNACILLVAVGAIMVESIGKLYHPVPVEGGMIAWVAGVGIVVNAFTAWLFMKDRKRDLNVRGAYLHMAADTLVSVGVVVSGLIISRTGWYLLDPLIGLLIAGVILVSTWGLLRESLRLSLDGVPSGIDARQIVREIEATDPCVREVHHLHIWALSTTENALTAHLVVDRIEDTRELKHKIKTRLAALNIGHATLEFETVGEHCHDLHMGYRPAAEQERG